MAARAWMTLAVLAVALLVASAVAAPVTVDVDQIEQGDAVLNTLAHEAQELDEQLPVVNSDNAYDSESATHSEGGEAEDELAALDAAEDEDQLAEAAADADWQSLSDLDSDLDALTVEVDESQTSEEDEEDDEADDSELDEDSEEETAAPKPPTPATNKPLTSKPTGKPPAATTNGANAAGRAIAPMAPMKKYTGTAKPWPVFEPIRKIMSAQPLQWDQNKCPLCRCLLNALVKAPKTCTKPGGLMAVCKTCAPVACTTVSCPNVCSATAQMDGAKCADMVELAAQAKNVDTACDALRLCAQ